MAVWQAVADGVRLRVRLQPGAKTERIDGPVTLAGGATALKVRISAPAAAGKANAALTAFLAKRWKRPKAAVTIVGGAGAREKTLHIAGDPADLAARLRNDIGESNEQGGEA